MEPASHGAKPLSDFGARWSTAKRRGKMIADAHGLSRGREVKAPLYRLWEGFGEGLQFGVSAVG